MLGSANALPNPFIMMGKGPEEVEDLLGVRSLHLHVHPMRTVERDGIRWECKAHAQHVEPNGSNGAGSSTVTACESGMRGATGDEVRHRWWFDDPGCHTVTHGGGQRAASVACRAGWAERCEAGGGAVRQDVQGLRSLQGRAGSDYLYFRLCASGIQQSHWIIFFFRDMECLDTNHT